MKKEELKTDAQRVTIIAKPLTALPPAPGYCQVCAVKHDPQAPHDATSFYYQTVFQMNNARRPTWADAMAHCDDVVKLQVRIVLDEKGIDPNSTNVYGPQVDKTE